MDGGWESQLPVASPDLAIYHYEQACPARTLIDILNASISAFPTATAIDNGTRSLTYTQLCDEIATRADGLRSIGVGVGDRVGVRISSGTLDLYLSILAVLSVGAAYVPVDVEDPDERADIVWAEANVCAVITENSDGLIIKIQQDISTKTEVRQSKLAPTPEDDAWIIFTSGSTGKPKGVAVSHASAAAFVDAEAQLFLPKNQSLGPGDRVLASLSVAFDASCEEMWLAWRHGACLVPVPRSLVKAGADLGTFLAAQQITVVSTVPTLAALWPTATLAGLHLLILGGEACSPELATRLARAVKCGKVWNTYGPTEATVVSCAAALTAEEPLVRIGLPLKGWKLAVVSPDGTPVRWGEEGELVIGGAGMARYLDLEKDRAKFRSERAFSGERAYRSGDLVRADRDGLVFIRRNDEQIKLGGRRIELGEIDAALMTLPGVSAAASTIQRSETGTQLLVGYIVCDSDEKSSIPHSQKSELLRRMLPPTLVPLLVTMNELPVRTSGKVDRGALPWPPPNWACSDAKDTADMSITTAWLSQQWRSVLGVPASPGSNFFQLGGTSLGAAQLVSQIRKQYPTISVADIYEHPILHNMAAYIDEISITKSEDRRVAPTPRWTGAVQCAILSIAFTVEGLRWLSSLALTKKIIAAFTGPDTWASQHDLPWWLIAVMWVFFITMPGRLSVTAGIVRLLTLRIRPGSYRRGGIVHLRLWAAERFIIFGRIEAIAGTQWCRRYARLLGCYVGHDAQLGALPPATGLASFGAASVVGPEADVRGWWLDGDVLHIGYIVIGHGARVGARSFLMPDTVLEPYSIVPPGTCFQGVAHPPDVIPSHHDHENEQPGSDSGEKATFWTGFRYTSSLLLLDFLPMLLVTPVWALAATIVHDYGNFRNLCISLMEMAAPGAVVGTVLYATTVIILVRLASAAIRPGVHSWHRSPAWAAWLTHYLLMEARVVLFPIYASLFTSNWLRLLGARVGHNVEASTVVPIPSLVNVEDSAFLADDVLLSHAVVQNGQILLGQSTVEVKAFVGNSAIIDPEITVPKAALIGVLGKASADMESGSSWLGRPPMLLPRRVEEPASNKRTFEPPKRLKLARGSIEACRLLSLICSGILSVTVGAGILFVIERHGFSCALLGGGGLLVAAGFAACVIAILARWILTPRVHRGQQHPLWSSFVWRNELADTFIQSLALPWLIRHCYGTPLMSMWMRSLGAHIGRGVWIDSHIFPEAALVELHDGVTINRASICQTHLFHDRIMRLDKVVFQQGATLGPFAISLPSTTIGAGTTIGPASLVMRGETIPAGSRWIGNPVRPWRILQNIQSGSSDSGVDEDK